MISVVQQNVFPIIDSFDLEFAPNFGYVENFDSFSNLYSFRRMMNIIDKSLISPKYLKILEIEEYSTAITSQRRNEGFDARHFPPITTRQQIHTQIQTH